MTLLISTMLLVGCQSEQATYTPIDQQQAKKMMEEENVIILDVRTNLEYIGGHIVGAINIPNEEIDKSVTEVLKDKDQIILVYCRSGNRSKTASSKLASYGYNNIYEFGGINTWDGPTEKGN